MNRLRDLNATMAAGVEKTLHDARGAFATRLLLAGLGRDQIADIMGWKKDRLDRILTRYVDQATVITAMVEKLRANEKRTKLPNAVQIRPYPDEIRGLRD